MTEQDAQQNKAGWRIPFLKSQPTYTLDDYGRVFDAERGSYNEHFTNTGFKEKVDWKTFAKHLEFAAGTLSFRKIDPARTLKTALRLIEEIKAVHTKQVPRKVIERVLLAIEDQFDFYFKGLLDSENLSYSAERKLEYLELVALVHRLSGEMAAATHFNEKMKRVHAETGEFLKKAEEILIQAFLDRVEPALLHRAMTDYFNFAPDRRLRFYEELKRRFLFHPDRASFFCDLFPRATPQHDGQSGKRGNSFIEFFRQIFSEDKSLENPEYEKFRVLAEYMLGVFFRLNPEAVLNTKWQPAPGTYLRNFEFFITYVPECEGSLEDVLYSQLKSAPPAFTTILFILWAAGGNDVFVNPEHGKKYMVEVLDQKQFHDRLAVLIKIISKSDGTAVEKDVEEYSRVRKKTMVAEALQLDQVHIITLIRFTLFVVKRRGGSLDEEYLHATCEAMAGMETEQINSIIVSLLEILDPIRQQTLVLKALSEIVPHKIRSRESSPELFMLLNIIEAHLADTSEDGPLPTIVGSTLEFTSPEFISAFLDGWLLSKTQKNNL